LNPDVIEAQLAHGKSGPLDAAHDRAEFMGQRRKLMSLRADYLDHLRDGNAAAAFNAARRISKGLRKGLPPQPVSPSLTLDQA